MPLSRAVARFNRRITNRVLGRIARWAPGFAVLTHTGRRSGRTYQIPINVFRDGDGYRIALTYGADTDWVRNVLAAGGCTIETRGKRIALTHPRIMSDTQYRWVPLVLRQILRLVSRLVGVPQYMELTIAETIPHGPAQPEERDARTDN